MKSVDQVMLELTPIFREALDDERLNLTTGMSARDVEGWDSFTHTQLIAAIEQHYGIQFQLREILNFKNVGDMCSAVAQLTQ